MSRKGGIAMPLLDHFHPSLALNAELALPVDLEASYTIACQRRRLA
jgi:hypothetical protein